MAFAAWRWRLVRFLAAAVRWQHNRRNIWLCVLPVHDFRHNLQPLRPMPRISCTRLTCHYAFYRTTMPSHVCRHHLYYQAYSRHFTITSVYYSPATTTTSCAAWQRRKPAVAVRCNDLRHSTPLLSQRCRRRLWIGGCIIPAICNLPANLFMHGHAIPSATLTISAISRLYSPGADVLPCVPSPANRTMIRLSFSVPVARLIALPFCARALLLKHYILRLMAALRSVCVACKTRTHHCVLRCLPWHSCWYDDKHVAAGFRIGARNDAPQ